MPTGWPGQMTALFYSAAAVALIATALAISRAHIVHALLYLSLIHI